MWTAMKILIILFTLIPSIGFAQDPSAEPSGSMNAGFEMGAHIGNILPNQVDGVSEIHPQWGLRTGFGLGGDTTCEIGGTAGKGNGADWTQASASLRVDMPIEHLVGVVFLGLDVTRFEGVGRPKKIFGGGHVGGGVMTLLSRNLWFRADMKFNINPGTSLYIGGGFLLRFGGGEQGN